MLAGSGYKEESTSKATDISLSEDKPERSGKNIDADDSFEILRKVKKIIDKTSNVNDPRVTLLHSIKPFLGNNRQKKLANCINILRMSSLTSLFDDSQLASLGKSEKD
jgi:hypothetical protein